MEPSQRRATSNERILIVEDDVNLSHTFVLVLQRAGHIVTSTDNTNSALNLIQNTSFCLVVLDTHMQDTRSVLLPKILRAYPGLPIIILTDPPVISTKGEINMINAHYVAKPIAPEDLLDCINQYCV